MRLEVLSGRNRRRSIRLPAYDYTQSGAYVITIVTRERDSLFGEVVDDRMCLSRLGQVAHREWERLGRRFPNVVLDAFVVMPNHVHGIIILNDAPGRGAAGHPSDRDRSMPCPAAGGDGHMSRCAPTMDAPTGPRRGAAEQTAGGGPKAPCHAAGDDRETTGCAPTVAIIDPCRGAAGHSSDQDRSMPCPAAGDDGHTFRCAPTTTDADGWGRVAPGSIAAIVRAASRSPCARQRVSICVGSTRGFHWAITTTAAGSTRSHPSMLPSRASAP